MKEKNEKNREKHKEKEKREIAPFVSTVFSSEVAFSAVVQIQGYNIDQR